MTFYGAGLSLAAPLFNAVPAPARGEPRRLTGVLAQGLEGGNSFNFVFMHNVIDYLSFYLLNVIFCCKHYS
jgi:hypothetical protein